VDPPTQEEGESRKEKGGAPTSNIGMAGRGTRSEGIGKMGTSSEGKMEKVKVELKREGKREVREKMIPLCWKRRETFRPKVQRKRFLLGVTEESMQKGK